MRDDTTKNGDKANVTTANGTATDGVPPVVVTPAGRAPVAPASETAAIPGSSAIPGIAPGSVPSSPTPTSGSRSADAQRSITEFLTDGSLAALASELTGLLGVRVQLRDADGRLIVPAGGAKPWQAIYVDEIEGAELFPLTLGDELIGNLAIGPEPIVLAAPDASARDRLRRAITWLGRAASELVNYESELRNKLRELAVVYKLSALLSRATRVERILEVALESAIDVLELDAGSIMLLTEDADGILSENEQDLVLKASRNLSASWLENPLPLSKDRAFDQMAMRGEVMVCANIATDPRILLRDEAAAEGLGAAINAGLIFQGKPIGVIRLYSRSPRNFSDSERRLLRGIAEQAAVAVEQSRLLRIKEEEEAVQRQLSFAQDVQRRMMPRSFPPMAGIDAAARWTPSLELSGDFYDVFEVGGSNLGVVIGDVVGKGIGAALMMSAVRASLRAHVQDLYDLDEVISRVNAAMCRDTQDSEFATIWYGVLDPDKLRLTYCSAGHEPPMVVRMPPSASRRGPTMADLDELTIGGMAVGIDPHQRYQRGVFDLRPSDTLVAYTDGILDARSFSGEKFGRARLRSAVLRILSEEPNASASRVAEMIQWEVRRFAGLSDRVDDETLVVVRVMNKQ